MLFSSISAKAQNRAACLAAGTLCYRAATDETLCSPCPAGQECRKFSNGANHYCQYIACLTEGAVCSGRVGICCDGLSCGKLDGADSRTCNAPVTTPAPTTEAPTTAAPTTEAPTTIPSDVTTAAGGKGGCGKGGKGGKGGFGGKG